jgi:hypothetical protein
MASTRTRDAALTVVGFAAWLLYVLGCASFSPDDSKVLFPSNDPKTGGTVVAMYDRTTRTTRTLAALPVSGNPHDDRFCFRPGWTADGTHAVVIWPQEEALSVMVIPLASKEPIRIHKVGDMGSDPEAALMLPPVMAGSYLFVNQEKGVLRLDLYSGATRVVPREVAGAVWSGWNSVFYMRPPAGVKWPEKGENYKGPVEFGVLDPNTLAAGPKLLGLTPGMPGMGDEGFSVSASRSARFAISSGEDGIERVLIFEGASLLRTVEVASIAGKEAKFGFPKMSSDGSMVYAASIKPLGDGGLSQVSVIEIPAGAGPARETPLFQMTDSKSEDNMKLQVDVSHDGKTLAVVSTYLQERPQAVKPGEKPTPPRIKPEDVALYLVDLARADRRVTKVPVPALPAAPAPPAE